MKIVEGLKYTKDHEWVKVDGEKAYIGITDFAQEHLGDVVYVELPEIGISLEAGGVVSVTESSKAASDVYTPIEGVVLEVNDMLSENPAKINEEPYESWIAVLKINNPSQLNALMDAIEYEKYCAEGE